MVNNIEFRNVSNDVQKKLKNDISEIKTCNKIFSLKISLEFYTN